MESEALMLHAVLLAIGFAVSFALLFFGIIVAIHFNTWLGLIISAVGFIKFWSYLPELQQ